jgi:hypothetical protein
MKNAALFSLHAGLVHTQLEDVRRQSVASRRAKALPARNGHRTRRRRPLWWIRTTGGTSATPRTA